MARLARLLRLQVWLPIVAVLAVSGCSSVGFYMQAIGGHLEIMSRREPVSRLLEQTADAELRQRLELASAARDFASARLALPDNGSYRSYVDLQRRYVTWNVIAAPELSVEAHTWCFPVAGCVPYRGYFSERSARVHGEQLAGEGMDVHINGASAYSTLGWFDDPLLSTMLRWHETRLVGVIFHELAHQRVWLEDDTTFNESFAVFVQREGVRQWLRERGSAAQLDEYARGVERRRQFVALLLATRERLAEVYAGEGDRAAKRDAKQRVFAGLRERYAALREGWGGYAGYDRWFEQPLNNARLALTATYHDDVDAFARLFSEAGGDFERFYARIGKIAAMDPATRARTLGRSQSLVRR